MEETIINSLLNSKENNEDNTEDTLKNLLTLYDHINYVDINRLFIGRLYTNNSFYQVETNGDFNDYIKEFAQRYVHPDDVGTYKESNMPENIRKQVNEAEKGFCVTYYRVSADDDAYIWKAFVIVKLKEGSEGEYLSCMRDVDATTEHILIRNDYVRLLNDMPLAYAVLQVDADENENITDVKCAFLSNRAVKFLGLESFNNPGKSILSFFDEENLPIKRYLYDAAYKDTRNRASIYIKRTGKWVTAVTDKGAQRGRCALILEDVTKEKLTIERLGMEWRTDDLIISCTKILHSGLPIEVSIKKLIKMIGEAIEADRIYIIEKIGDDLFSETYEWCNEGLPTTIQRFANMSREDLLNWEVEYPGAFNLVIEDINALTTAHPRLYNKFLEMNVHTLIELPINDDGQLIGYFGATNYSLGKSVNAKQLLETVSYFLSSEFGRIRLINELEKRSIYDALCGVKNRSAMEIASKKLKRKEFMVGVIYADVNGLKGVNDSLGHEAGDELLKRVCVVLKRRFNRDCIYRAGGDEFVIILPNVAREEFENSCEALTEDFQNEQGIAVALGWDWGIDSAEIETIMKTADKNMYEDKANYYRKNNRRRSTDR